MTQKQSLRLPDAWAKSLLAKLRAIYGAKFDSQWKGVDQQEMADMWAEALGQFQFEGAPDGERIKWALIACRDNNPFPPTLPEFIALCRQAPRREQKALTEPVVPPEVARERAEKVERTFAEQMSGKRDMKAWAKRIKQMQANGDRLTALQIKYADEALCNT